MIPLLDPTRWWECPSCHRQESTREIRPHAPFHECPAHAGALVPSVEVHHNRGLARGAVRHVVRPREDYVGTELGLRYAAGVPVMSVVTERADGSNDCAVFPATAQGEMSHG